MNSSNDNTRLFYIASKADMNIDHYRFQRTLKLDGVPLEKTGKVFRTLWPLISLFIVSWGFVLFVIWTAVR